MPPPPFAKGRIYAISSEKEGYTKMDLLWP
jgi:hypothetical protein